MNKAVFPALVIVLGLYMAVTNFTKIITIQKYKAALHACELKDPK